MWGHLPGDWLIGEHGRDGGSISGTWSGLEDEGGEFFHGIGAFMMAPTQHANSTKISFAVLASTTVRKGVSGNGHCLINVSHVDEYMAFSTVHIFL